MTFRSFLDFFQLAAKLIFFCRYVGTLAQMTIDKHEQFTIRNLVVFKCNFFKEEHHVKHLHSRKLKGAFQGLAPPKKKTLTILY